MFNLLSRFGGRAAATQFGRRHVVTALHGTLIAMVARLTLEYEVYRTVNHTPWLI